ncbi:hypothetical protein Tco_1176645 [Tanacetum coccineum]
MADSTSTMVHEDKRWSLEEEVNKLIDETLDLSFPKLSFPELNDEEPVILPCKEAYGDYQCENVLSIWPKLREAKRPIKAIAVGASIHKMLKVGIDTWAPKLPVERVIIHIPSIASKETIDDRLRRTCIGDTLTRMLEYSKVVVSSSGSDLEARLAQEDELNKCFSFEERDGDVVDMQLLNMQGGSAQIAEVYILEKPIDWAVMNIQYLMRFFVQSPNFNCASALNINVDGIESMIWEKVEVL